MGLNKLGGKRWIRNKFTGIANGVKNKVGAFWNQVAKPAMKGVGDIAKEYGGDALKHVGGMIAASGSPMGAIAGGAMQGLGAMMNGKYKAGGDSGGGLKAIAGGGNVVNLERRNFQYDVHHDPTEMRRRKNKRLYGN